MARTIPLSAICAVSFAMLASCSGDKQKKDPPPLVSVAHPVRAMVDNWDEAVGRFVSIDAVDVRPRVTGYVTRIGFRDGQNVERGQMLFQIDPRPFQARLSKARAQVARASATLETANVELRRARALYAAQATSQQEVQSRLLDRQQASADLAAARADARDAALQLGYTTVRAAVSGRISDRKVNPGNIVNADQTVLTSIVTLDPIRFAFDLPESVYASYERQADGGRGAAVEIQLQGESGYPHKGHVEFIDNQVSTEAGTMRGRAVLPNPGGKLTPGQFGRMRLSGGKPYRAILVPDSAVTQDQDRRIVYYVGKDGKLGQSKVETGPRIGQWRVIRKGVTMGEQIVIGGQQKADPGQKVKVRFDQPRSPHVKGGASGQSQSDGSGSDSGSGGAEMPQAAAGIVVSGG